MTGRAQEPGRAERTQDEPSPDGKGRYARVNGLKMYYEVHGKGEPLIFLHGAFGRAMVLPTLAKDRQVIAVELQGHGHTADVDRPLSCEQMADDTAALLRHLGIKQADVFGYSMGGVVGIALAIRHPEMVRRLATFGSVSGPLDEAWEPEHVRQFKGLPADFAPPVLKDPYDQVAPDPKHWPVLVSKVKAMVLDFKGFTPEQMRSIRARVLLTFGDRDGFRPEYAVAMYRMIPNAQLLAGAQNQPPRGA